MLNVIFDNARKACPFDVAFSSGRARHGWSRAATDFKEVSLNAVNLVTYEKIERESGCQWTVSRVIGRRGAKIVAA